MSWFLKKLFNTSIKEISDSVKNVLEVFIENPNEAKKAEIEINRILSENNKELFSYIEQELKTKENILIAELNQNDNYTKRARPTVVYFGLLIILWNYVIIPYIGMSPVIFPSEFWMSWGGITSAWVVGRSFEKIKREKESKPKSLFGG